MLVPHNVLIVKMAMVALNVQLTISKKEQTAFARMDRFQVLLKNKQKIRKAILLVSLH